MIKMMNRILLGLLILTGSACTKIDNYGEPTASFEGRLIDATTGQNFLTTSQGINVRLEQISWSETPAPQDIPSKIDGSFKDSKLFPGKYRITPMGGAFWPVLEPVELDINKGTSHDFELTPYLIIKDFTTELDGTDLTLRFRLDAPIGAGLPQILDVQPYVNTSAIVGGGASIREYSEDLKVTVNKQWINMTDMDKTMEITVPGLLPGRIFYVRVGARLDDSYKSSNYSEIVKITVP